jgi:hypothetical protein
MGSFWRTLYCRVSFPALASRAALAIPVIAWSLASQPVTEPRFTAANELLRPTGYREWMFVTSNLGMGYREGAPASDPEFHNIYIQPAAYREYRETGRFPDHTMLVMERVSSGTNASINRTGRFQDKFLGIEVAVKDEARFPGKWAYFNLGSSAEKAKAFPKEACWNCHNEHGAVDNVFVQFYPVLKK